MPSLRHCLTFLRVNCSLCGTPVDPYPVLLDRGDRSLISNHEFLDGRVQLDVYDKQKSLDKVLIYVPINGVIRQRILGSYVMHSSEVRQMQPR